MDRSPNSVCLLCNAEKANKMGSHMMPAFLISSAISYQGNTKRDNELMIMTKPSGFSETFIGRKVLPEAIETVKKIGAVENENIENINPNIRDNFFCNDCEKRLSIVESYYASEIYPKLENDIVETQKSKNGYDITLLHKEKAAIARLFFLSIFWRVSIAGFLQLKMSEKAEKRIRRLLSECLDLDSSAMVQNTWRCEKELGDFPLMIVLASNEKNKTKRPIYADKHRYPHFLILNRCVVFLYEKKSHINNPMDTFFGLTDLLNKTELISSDSNTLPIGILTLKQTESLQGEFVKMQIERMINTSRLHFSTNYERFFGMKPTDDIIYTFLHRMNRNQVLQYDRFSEETTTNVMAAFLSEINDYGLKYGKPLRFSIGDIHPDEYRLPKLKEFVLPSVIKS